MVKLADETAIAPARIGQGGFTVQNSRAGAEGEALVKLGGSIEKIGDAATSIKTKIEKDETDAEQWQYNAKLIDFEAKQRRALEEARRNQDGDPTGFGMSRVSEYDAAAKEFQKQVPERLRDWSNNRLVQLRGQIESQTGAFEAQRKDSFFGEQTSKTLDELKRQIDSDPARYDELRNQGAELIRQAPVSPDAKKRMEEAWRAGAPTALIMSEMRSNPGKVRAGMGLATGDTVEAERKAIRSIESDGSGGYSALGPTIAKGTYAGDRAYGAYQVMGRNIPQWTKEALGKSMTPQEFLASPEAQDAVFDFKFGQLKKKYGNASDAASAWFTGLPASQGANRSDGNLRGSQYVQKFEAALERQGVGVRPDARYEGLTYEQRVRFAEVAKREQERMERASNTQQKLEQASVKTLMDDDLSSIQNTGKPVAELTRERVENVYGAEAATAWERKRQNAQTVYETTSEFPRLSNEKIAEVLSKMKPKGGEAGFKEQQATYDAINKAAEKTYKEREEDPALSVRALKPVEDALAAFRSSGASPQNWQSLADARLQAQAAIGIPESSQSPITVAEARRLMAPVTDAQEGDQIKALTEVAKTFDRLFGKHSPAAFAAAINSVSVDKETARAAAPILRRMIAGQRVPQNEMAAFEAAMQDQTLYRAVAPLASEYDPFKASPGGGPMFGPPGDEGPQPSTPQTRVIPQSAISELRRNPQAAEAFMQKYGKDEYGRGAAQKIIETLGGKPQQKRAQ